MEGITSFLIGLGVSAAFAVILYLVFKFKVSPDFFSLANLGSEIAKITVKMLFANDKEKQDKYLPYIQLLIVGINEVESSKADIQAKMLREGWNEEDREKLHEAYTNEAIEIAKRLGSIQGLDFDEMSLGIFRTAVKFMLGFFRFGGQEKSPESNQLSEGIHEIVQDKSGYFRPSEK
jgi:hypothetical protein